MSTPVPSLQWAPVVETEAGKTLDLTNGHLTSLDSVEFPPDIIEADLTANRLKELDARILALPELRKLSVRQNLFTTIDLQPASFKHTLQVRISTYSLGYIE